MLTSDGRAYLVHWGPSSASLAALPPLPKISPETPVVEEVLIDEKAELRKELESEKWGWEGKCFFPPRTLEGEEGIVEQELELDKGRAGSSLGVNEKMGLVAVGCEECVPSFLFLSGTDADLLAEYSGTLGLFDLSPSKLGQTLSTSSSGRDFPTPTLSHVLSLRNSLNSTASGLATGRVTCLSWSVSTLSSSLVLTVFAGPRMGTHWRWAGSLVGRCGRCMGDWVRGRSLGHLAAGMVSRGRRASRSRITLCTACGTS